MAEKDTDIRIGGRFWSTTVDGKIIDASQIDGIDESGIATNSYVENNFTPIPASGNSVPYFDSVKNGGYINVNQNVGEGTVPSAYTLGRYNEDGSWTVGSPVNGNHAANKDYVDNGFVAKTTSTGNRVYVSQSQQDGTIVNSTIQYSSDVDGETIAIRDSSGSLHGVCTDDSSDSTLTTKAYVESKIRGKVDYLGTVAGVGNLSLNAGRGDYHRASGSFTIQSIDGKHKETVHAGDFIISKYDLTGNNGTQNLDNWDVIHSDDEFVTLDTEQTLSANKIIKNSDAKIIVENTQSNTSTTTISTDNLSFIDKDNNGTVISTVAYTKEGLSYNIPTKGKATLLFPLGGTGADGATTDDSGVIATREWIQDNFTIFMSEYIEEDSNTPSSEEISSIFGE